MSGLARSTHSKGIILCFRRCPLKNMCISVESGRSWSRIWERRIMRKERNKWVTWSLSSSAWSTFQYWKGEIQFDYRRTAGSPWWAFQPGDKTTFKRISSEQSAQGLHGWPWKGVSFLSGSVSADTGECRWDGSAGEEVKLDEAQWFPSNCEMLLILWTAHLKISGYCSGGQTKIYPRK